MSKVLYCMVAVAIVFMAALACGSVDKPVPDEEYLLANYRFETPTYHIKVAFRGDVAPADVNDLLDKIDTYSLEVGVCLYGVDVGFLRPRSVFGHTTDRIPPLDSMRVFIVPSDFECDLTPNEICAGYYVEGYRKQTGDVIVVSRENFKNNYIHELWHRYDWQHEDEIPCDTGIDGVGDDGVIRSPEEVD